MNSNISFEEINDIIKPTQDIFKEMNEKLDTILELVIKLKNKNYSDIKKDNNNSTDDIVIEVNNITR